MATLGDTIRTRRKELGLSQAELAQACGVHLRQIRRYESDEQQPVLTVAVQLAAALGLSIAELAGEPSRQPRLDGTWWAAWQTFVKGEQIITSQPVALQQLGQTVRIEALEHSTEKTIADYLWRGELRVWATPWHEERALPALRQLLELPFELVLVSHGEPVHDRAAYERALERPPWDG
jgi:transcriptional regulator with XRE-family HTH domain